VNDIKLYAGLWRRLTGEEFSDEKLAARIRNDGGVDIHNLSDDDVLALIRGTSTAPAKEVLFTFGEMLATYSVEGGIDTPEQIVSWVFTAFVISDAVRAGLTDWDFHFDNFMNGYLAIRSQLEIDESVAVMTRIFGENRKGML